jgi:hypothetical protein
LCLSDTSIQEIRSLKVGRYIVIDNEPCKLVEYITSKPGKHGEAKARMVAIGLFDKQKRSTRGTWTLCFTGCTRERFCLSKSPIATIRALASPCFPGLEVIYSTNLHGSPSMTMYLPTFRERISCIDVSLILVHHSKSRHLSSERYP